MFTLLNSAFLMALPLVALPILLHMFHRRKRVRIAWGAMQFLTQAATKRKRLMRLADILLMLLRLAAILAIILALTQPMMKSKALGQDGPRDVVLVLDTSLSMAQINEPQSSFDKAIAAADGVIESLKASDSIRVMVNGAVAEPLTSAWVKGGSSAKKEIQAQLHKLTPTLGSSDVLSAITSALDIEPADKQATRYVVVIGDNQALSWHPERAEEWKSLGEKIKKTPTSCDHQRNQRRGKRGESY